MKRGGRISICLIGAMALTLVARAVVNDSDKLPVSTGDSPYNTIWLRNVFDLKPVPLPVAEKPKDNEPPPNVTLTGITTMLGKKRAMFMVKKGQQPGKPAGKDESYILTEGERRDALEVVAINPVARTVKISIDGTESTITFETNKPSGGPQMAGGAPPQPGSFPQPGFSPPGGGVSRPMRAQGNSFSPTANQGGGYNQPSGYQPGGYQGGGGYAGYAGGAQAGYSQPAAGNSVGASLGNALFGQNPAPAVAPAQVQQPAMDPDVQKVIMAANQAAHQDEISAGTYPPMPPIPGLTAPSAGESTGQK